jgi:hypothetical protein
MKKTRVLSSVFFSRLEIMGVLARKKYCKNAMSISQNVELDADIEASNFFRRTFCKFSANSTSAHECFQPKNHFVLISAFCKLEVK